MDTEYINNPKAEQKRRPKNLWLVLALFSMVFFIPTAGFSCDSCGCAPTFHGVTIPPNPDHTTQVYCPPRDTIRCLLRDEHQITTDHILEEFPDFEEFLLSPVWPDYIRPAWMMMTEQLVVAAMDQAMMIGTLFDAKQQLETQTIFQKLTAEAHKDYHPNHSMCVIGTNIRSLAAAERNYELSTFVLSQRSIDRQMGNMNSSAARGLFDDQCFRLRQFRARYCNLHDNNDHMNMICNPDPANLEFPECMPTEINITPASQNKDISFSRTVDRANTLDIDFYTPAGSAPNMTALSEDEQDIFALGSNLYSHDVMFRLPEASMRQRNSQDELLDMRTIIAKREVAEHSFHTIVGMKAMGTEQGQTVTQPYMRLILESLGIGLPANVNPDEEIAYYLGDRPSYYAQMELLTKRVFQSPDFFVNLYDEPTNVERQSVDLQAIGLMQDFDIWQSYLRTEAMLSVVLELELLRLNNQVTDQMNSMRSGGIEL